MVGNLWGEDAKPEEGGKAKKRPKFPLTGKHIFTFPAPKTAPNTVSPLAEGPNDLGL